MAPEQLAVALDQEGSSVQEEPPGEDTLVSPAKEGGSMHVPVAVALEHDDASDSHELPTAVTR